ncbi:hypothetical protein HDU96_008430 [Phlyctochytrium bullatum]|nr:hypothetical protein HDU96_008430 [Phlyctochytrium bullatum]
MDNHDGNVNGDASSTPNHSQPQQQQRRRNSASPNPPRRMSRTFLTATTSTNSSSSILKGAPNGSSASSLHHNNNNNHHHHHPGDTHDDSTSHLLPPIANGDSPAPHPVNSLPRGRKASQVMLDIFDDAIPLTHVDATAAASSNTLRNRRSPHALTPLDILSDPSDPIHVPVAAAAAPAPSAAVPTKDSPLGGGSPGSNGATKAPHQQPQERIPQKLLDASAKLSLDHCALCHTRLASPTPDDPEPWLPVRKLRPQLLREIRRLYPAQKLHPAARICRDEVRRLLMGRIGHLMEEDQTQLSRLLDEAMRNLGEYEQQEPQWQKQFESGWTFGERAADLVARFGGSWKFIGCLILFLALWMGLNSILERFDASPWDPFPFILLNLFLSSVAALQAPVIMMSQNRQSQLDRTVDEYVSRIVLRAEHQVRHINAKVDHLLSHQWKRLLEFQEIEVELIHNVQTEQRRMARRLNALLAASHAGPMTPYIAPGLSPSLPATASVPPLALGADPVAAATVPWAVEIVPDAHAWVLMRHHLGLDDDGGEEDDDIIFAHWHTDGDNYLGLVGNVFCEMRANGSVRRLVYELEFNDPSATLDDVLAGEGTVTLRNDFDLPHMMLMGRILRVEVHMKDRPPVSFANGELPPRYKPSFYLQRKDKITDFWKHPVTRLQITYAPPPQIAVLVLGRNQRLRHIRADFVPLAEHGAAAPTAAAPRGSAVGVQSDMATQPPVEDDTATLYFRMFDPADVDRHDDEEDSEDDAPAAAPTAKPAAAAAPAPAPAPAPAAAGSHGTLGSAARPRTPSRDSPRRQLLLPVARSKRDPRPRLEAPWRTLAKAEWRGEDVEEGVARPVRVWVEVDWVGPVAVALFCDEARVGLYGVVEEVVTGEKEDGAREV